MGIKLTAIAATGCSPRFPSSQGYKAGVLATIQIREAFHLYCSITLSWLQSPSRSFKPFVSSRVGEIQSNLNPRQWRHIPGEVNVADDVSRGVRVEELNGR